MDPKQLHTFITAGTLLHFSRAAERLGYTQANVTLHIQQLEKEFGGRLFERLGKTVTLTQLGKTLMPHARAVLKSLDDARAAMASAAGSLTIGSAESLCLYRLPAVLERFRARHPEVRLAVRLLDCAEYLPSLADGSVDVLFALGEELACDWCTVAEAQQEPVSVFARPDHSLARRKRLAARDFDRQPFLLTGDGCRYRGIFLNHLAARYARPEAMMETNSIPAIKRAAALGVGLCVLPDIAVAQELREGTLTRLAFGEIEWGLYSQVAYHRNKWLSPALQGFLDMIRSEPVNPRSSARRRAEKR